MEGQHVKIMVPADHKVQIVAVGKPGKAVKPVIKPVIVKPSRGERKALKRRASAGDEPVFPDWWIRCRKCGHQPRDTPQMACPSCNKVHPNWSPNPMEVVKMLKSQTLVVARQLAVARSEVDELEEGNCALRDNHRAVKASLCQAEQNLEAAELEREAVEVENMAKGPETKLRGDTLVQKAQRRVSDLTLQLCAAQEAVEKAETELKFYESKEKALEDREAELERKKAALLVENSKLLEALQGVDRRGAAPSPANALVMSPEVLALIGRGAMAAAHVPAR